MSRLSPLARRLILVTLLLIGYVVVLRPLRAVVAREAAFPLLAQQAAEIGVQADASQPRTVRLPQTGSEGQDLFYVVPGGLLFLVPAVLLLWRFPHQPYWMALLAAHLAAGVLDLFALYVCLNGLRWGEPLHYFMAAYALPAIALASSTLALTSSGLVPAQDDMLPIW